MTEQPMTELPDWNRKAEALAHASSHLLTGADPLPLSRLLDLLTPIVDLTFTAETTKTATGLNGNADDLWLVIWQGSLVRTSADRSFALRPNNDTGANYKYTLEYAGWADDTSKAHDVSNVPLQNGLVLQYTPFGETARALTIGFMEPKAGAQRALMILLSMIVPADTRDRNVNKAVSHWLNTADNITSITALASGDTATGRLRIYRLL